MTLEFFRERPVGVKIPATRVELAISAGRCKRCVTANLNEQKQTYIKNQPKTQMTGGIDWDKRRTPVVISWVLVGESNVSPLQVWESAASSRWKIESGKRYPLGHKEVPPQAPMRYCDLSAIPQ